MNIWLFSYEDVISRGTNLRLLGYYQYLEKQGHSPCFCFLKGSNKIKSKYNFKAFRSLPFTNLINVWAYTLNILFYKPCETVYFYGPNALFIPIYVVSKLRRIRINIEKVELDSIKQNKTLKDFIKL